MDTGIYTTLAETRGIAYSIMWMRKPSFVVHYSVHKLKTQSWGSVVGMTRVWAGLPRKVVRLPTRRQDIFLVSTACRTALEPTQHTIHWVPGYSDER